MKKLKIVGHIIEIFLKIFSILAILVLLLLYFICQKLHLHFDLFMIMVYPCGVVFIYVIYQFIKLFDSLKNNKPFNRDNVLRLRKSMISSFIISFLVIIALLFTVLLYSYYTLQLKVALLFISCLFFGFGTALYILSVLFKQATKYKEENDLTI